MGPGTIKLGKRLNRFRSSFQEFNKCIETCQKAIEIGRENQSDFKLLAKALARMASAYVKLEDYDNAKLYFEKSLTEHRTPETVSKLSDVEKVLKGTYRLGIVDCATTTSVGR